MAVDQRVLDAAVEIADGYYAHSPIDWLDLLDRVEAWTGVDLGSDADSPEIRAIKAHVRRIRRS